MQAAQVLAGYTLGQADLLRRAMGKKIQAEMDAQRANFIKGCKDVNNIGEEQANALFDIIDKFAGYGFNRSHAAAYALIAYVTAYLRTHYPAAFIAASLDGAVSDGDKEQVMALAQEARRYNLTLLPPMLSADAAHFTVPDDRTIRWSLAGISGVGASILSAITREVSQAPFASIEDFVSRVGEVLNRKHATALAAAGVFDEMCGSRVHAVMAMRDSFEGLANEAKARKGGQHSLFGDELVIDVETDAIDEKELLTLEREALGLSLSAHPLDSHIADLQAQGILTPSVAEKIIELAPVAVAALVDEVKKGKNKNAWMTIRISDEKGMMMVGCAEDLENAHLIKPGEVIILRLNSRTSQGERRINVEEVIGGIPENPPRIIEVHVRDELDRTALRRAIGLADPGNDRIRIINGDDVQITPPVVKATNDLLEDIKKVDGVEFAAL